jgi:hypothetical protein
MHTEDLSAGVQLADAVDSGGEGTRIVDKAVRRGNDNNAMALRCAASQRSAGDDYLIVWVGMQWHRAGHNRAAYSVSERANRVREGGSAKPPRHNRLST